jgi:hypothetical protein
MGADRHLPAALADHGVSADDYAKIQQARYLVDQVNADVVDRGGNIAYCVSMHVVEPVRPGGRVEIREGG